MPNWCTNEVQIRGPAEDIAALRELVDNDTHPFNFDALLPEPDNVDDETLVQWRIRRWGTKWNPSANRAEVEWLRAAAFATLTTAWTPPIGIFEEIHRRWPRLSIRVRWQEEDVHAGWIFTENTQFTPPPLEILVLGE